MAKTDLLEKRYCKKKSEYIDMHAKVEEYFISKTCSRILNESNDLLKNSVAENSPLSIDIWL